MNLLKKLTPAVKKRIRKEIEGELEKYRIYRTTSFEGRETLITTSYEAREFGRTNKTSDSVAIAAIHNVTEQNKREFFCKKIEDAVNRLPAKEKLLIKERYLSPESQYITDMKIYNFLFDPPISAATYNKIRDSAMINLALMLGINLGIDF